GSHVAARATFDKAALKAELVRIAKKVDQPHREAAVVLHGLHPAIVPARAGRVLDREAASAAIVAALASLTRGRSIALPTKIDEPRVTGPMLAHVAAQTRVALSAP